MHFVIIVISITWYNTWLLNAMHIHGTTKWLQTYQMFKKKVYVSNRNTSGASKLFFVKGLQIMLRAARVKITVIWISIQINYCVLFRLGVNAGSSGRAVQGLGLRPLSCWDCGFQSRRGACISVSRERFVSSGTGLCDGPITRPEESYRVVCLRVISKPQIRLYTYNN